MAIAFPFGIIRRREAVRPSARPSARSGPSSTRCSSLSSYLRPWREAASAAGGGTARPLLLLATAVLELSAPELLQAIQIRHAWSRGRAWPTGGGREEGEGGVARRRREGGGGRRASPAEGGRKGRRASPAEGGEGGAAQGGGRGGRRGLAGGGRGDSDGGAHGKEGTRERREREGTNTSEYGGVRLGIGDKGERVRRMPVGIGVDFQFQIPGHPNSCIRSCQDQFRIPSLNIYIQTLPKRN